jgi:hypothetical protein
VEELSIACNFNDLMTDYLKNKIRTCYLENEKKAVHALYEEVKGETTTLSEGNA